MTNIFDQIFNVLELQADEKPRQLAPDTPMPEPVECEWCKRPVDWIWSAIHNKWLEPGMHARCQTEHDWQVMTKPAIREGSRQRAFETACLAAGLSPERYRVLLSKTDRIVLDPSLEVLIAKGGVRYLFGGSRSMRQLQCVRTLQTYLELHVLAQGRKPTAYIISERWWLADLKASWDDPSLKAPSVQELASADFLIWHGLGEMDRLSRSGWEAREVSDLIDLRAASGLPTLLSSGLPPRGLRSEHAAAWSRLASDVLETMVEDACVIELRGVAA